MNQLTPEDIRFKFIHSLGMDDYHHALLRCDEYKIQCEKITPKQGENFGKPRTYFFIDGCERDFDDPENEIVWVKTIVRQVRI